MCNLFLPPEQIRAFFFVRIIDDPLNGTKAETVSYSETAITPDNYSLTYYTQKIYATQKVNALKVVRLNFVHLHDPQ